MHSLKRLLFATIAAAAALPVLADTRTTLEIGNLQYSVADLRPDDGMAALGLLSGWYGTALAGRYGYATPTVRDLQSFDSTLPQAIDARYQAGGLDARAGTDAAGALRLVMTGSTAALMTDPANYWTEQSLRTEGRGTLGFYLGAYSAVTLTLSGRTEILRTNPESASFIANTSYFLSSGDQQYHYNSAMWGGQEPPGSSEQLLTFTLVNNAAHGVIQYVEVSGYAQIIATQVPEPSTIGMLGAGLALLWWRRRTVS